MNDKDEKYSVATATHVASTDEKIKALAAAVLLLSNAVTPHGSEYEVDKVLDAVGLGRLST